MRDIEEFQKLIKLMCIALVQQTIIINWRRPIRTGRKGEVFLDGRGVINFDIDPKRSDEEIYEIALHEVAHCLAGHLDNLPHREIPAEMEKFYTEKGPLFDELTAEQWNEYWQSPEEVEARNIAHEIDRVASNLSLTRFGDDAVENRIVVLSQIETGGESHE